MCTDTEGNFECTCDEGFEMINGSCVGELTNRTTKYGAHFSIIIILLYICFLYCQIWMNVQQTMAIVATSTTA